MDKKIIKNDSELMQHIAEIFRAVNVSTIMNAYAIENVAFGELKPGDKIPFEKFVEELGLDAWQPYSVRDSIEGVAIAEKETIADKDIGFFEKECFIFHRALIFGLPSFPRSTS